MKKPEHQWETRAHRAHRLPEGAWSRNGPFADDARAEAFELRFSDGSRGLARCGLRRQEVDARAAQDPELVQAITAWLIARGARRIDLHDHADQVLAARAIAPADLSDAPLRAAPRRLITLCPSNAELIDGLGCFDRVIACEDSSDWPAASAGLPRLGPDLAPDLDRIAALEPDLVVSSLSVPGMERNVTGLRARGIPQLVLAPRSLEDVLAEIDSVGAALQAEPAARALRAAMEAEVAQLEAALDGDAVPVYLEWWPRPMFTPGRDCYSNALIRLAGGRNVFEDRPGSSVEVDVEDLRAADPRVCFVSWCGVSLTKLDPQQLVSRPGLETLAAARERRVFAVDEAFTGRPGPRMLEASRIMARAIRGAREGKR